MTKLTTFWIVCRVAPTISATRHHDTEQAANAEAERLTAKENTPFYVFRLERRCEPATIPVQWVVPVENEIEGAS